MSEVVNELDDVWAFCATDNSELQDIWAEIEHNLCHRDKHKPPRVLVDMQHMMFRNHGFALDVFIDTLTNGVWADLIRDRGRLAIVIGTHKNVCVCGQLELLDALAEISDRSPHIHLAASTEVALNWLTSA